MIIPDHEIKRLIKNKELIINPYFNDFQGPNCYYCHLGTKFMIPKKDELMIIDPLKIKDSNKYFDLIESTEKIKINPGEFLLAETFESFGVSQNYGLRLLNSSSLARWGIAHAATGMVNPGCGIEKPVKITLELFNNFPKPILLTPTIMDTKGDITFGTEVMKIIVEKLISPPEKPYNTWKNAAYGEDYNVQSSKMSNRFRQVINIKEKLNQ
ncbi:MAG: hypothetical protein PHN56_03860 [Candidatus Nanoarchaeia archaeon]|nr:hypothetical protein [Candidatus Nanoarchaeia archaeon]